MSSSEKNSFPEFLFVVVIKLTDEKQQINFKIAEYIIDYFTLETLIATKAY